MFTVDERRNNFSKELKSMKKNQIVILELKNTVSEIKKSVDEFYS